MNWNRDRAGSESFGGAPAEAAEVLTDTLAEGFESLEAGGTLDGLTRPA